MRTIFLPVLLVPGLAWGTLAPLSAQEGVPDPKAPGATADERDWLESYYEHPDPDRFVPQMKDWAKDGTLDNDHAKPALIAFASQVLRQNRERIREWDEALAGLSPEQKQILYTAMLYSRTAEADELMGERFGAAYKEQRERTGKILELALDKRDTLDMLWGYFYATGSPGAIRRLVVAFRFRDAPDDPGGVNVPEGHMPLYKALPEFAHGSLLANAERHPRLVGILRELLEEDTTLLKSEREGVEGVLKELGTPGR